MSSHFTRRIDDNIASPPPPPPPMHFVSADAHAYDKSTMAAMSLMDIRRSWCTRYRIEAYIEKDQFSELTVHWLEWVEHQHQNK